MKLFISYSRDDKAWVYELRNALRGESDHDVWLDRGLVPGQDWWQTILENIESHECFVYVLTPMSAASIYCRAELDYALALNKPILPLMLKQCDYPAALKHIQYQSITDDMSMDRVLLRVERGLNAVQRDMDRGKYTAPTSAPPRPPLPTPTQEPQQVSEVFALAEEAAAENNVPLAEKLFKQVMEADPQGWGLAAAERLAEIRRERDRARDYLPIVRMAGNPATVAGARAAARVFVQKYGLGYDPNGILPGLTEAARTLPPANSTIVQPPAPAQGGGWDRTSLAEAMIARLDVNEVKDLCFRLGVDDENLDRSTKNSLVRSLISYMERRQQLDVLIGELVRLRPDIKPPSAPASKDTSAATPPAREQDAQPQARPRIEVAPPPPTPESGHPKLGDRMTDDKGVTMVYVPPGTFMMGSKDWQDAEPHKQIIAQGFWLDLTPVTNAMYAQFVTAGGYQKQEFWTKGGWAWVQKAKGTGPKDYQRFTDPEQPRVGVTWFEADAYCRWRGGRLPTEAEWEWAARGPENRQYPWGNEFDAKRVVFNDNSGGKTAPVNANTRLDGASWVGALDMSGNVWEWTSSLYQPYPYKAEDGRESLEDDKKARVVRGGSWSSDVFVLQAAYRLRVGPSFEFNDFGLRCARSS